MCSVVGFVAKQGKTIDLDIARNLILANQCRGRHALGFSWVDSAGRLRMWKRGGIPSSMIGRGKGDFGMLAMAEDARLFIGHLRWATHGDPTDNITNHPHPVDGGWLCHNGVVANYEALLSKYRIVPTSDCDSEIFGILAERSPEKTQLGRMISAVDSVASHSPTVVLGIWHKPQSVIAIRRGNPLHMGETEGGYYMASLPNELPGEVYSIRDNTAFRFILRGMATDVERESVGVPFERRADKPARQSAQKWFNEKVGSGSRQPVPQFGQSTLYGGNGYRGG